MSGEDQSAWIAVARIVKPHGVRGELAADLETDFPERFAGLAEVSLLGRDGRRRGFRLNGHRFHAGRVLLTLEGIADMDAARAWVGAEVQVPASARTAAPAGAYFISDLEGCRVWDGEREVGTIVGVEVGAGAGAAGDLRA